jgi:hypothetical protein
MLIPTDKTELAGRSRVAASSVPRYGHLWRPTRDERFVNPFVVSSVPAARRVLDTVAGRDLLGTNGS